MDKIPVVVPSFKLNFMAERTIATMGEQPYVVHVSKTPSLIRRWRRSDTVDEAMAPEHRTMHCFVIEDVLARRHFPDMDGDLVVFTDHDFAWHPGHFAKTKSMLLDAMGEKTIMAWLQSFWMQTDSNGKPWPFHTCPMFVARRCKATTVPGCWVQDRSWPDGDTGWGLARYLRHCSPDNVVKVPFDYPGSGIHLGGKWHLPLFRVDGLSADDPTRIIEQETMLNNLVNGQFEPHGYEHEIMCGSGVFHRYLKEQAHMPDWVEYDDSLYLDYRCDDYYRTMWREVACLPESMPRLEKRICLMLDGQERYSRLAETSGVPWYVIASVHAMEAEDEADFWMRSLHNGLPWNEKNVHALGKPGPFSSFEEAALHALRKAGPVTKGIVEVSRYLEMWNGISKFKRMGWHSPYLYAHSNKVGCYGKYKRLIVQPDGSSVISERVVYSDKIRFKFVPDIYNNQVGCVVALKVMHERGIIQVE